MQKIRPFSVRVVKIVGSHFEQLIMKIFVYKYYYYNFWRTNSRSKKNLDKYRIRYLYSLLLFTLLVCLSVCFYPINVKTADPLGPTFFVEPRVTHKKFASNKI